jgi:hypothetical protein
VGEKINAARVLVGYLKEKNQFQNLGVDGKIILKGPTELGGEGAYGICQFEGRKRWRAVCGRGEERSSSTKCRELLDSARNSWLLKKDSASWI